MRRWGPRFDWKHLQDWVPGVLGASAVILLVVVAANSPTRINSKPAELPPSQSAALLTKSKTDSPRIPSQPGASQTSSIADTAGKAPALPPPAAVISTGETVKPAPMHDHAMVKAQAEPASPGQSYCGSGEGPTERRRRQRRRIARRPPRGAPGLQKMSGLSFAGAGKDHPGSKLGRYRRPQVGDRCQFQLFAGDEAGGFDVGSVYTRCLSGGSCESSSR